MSLAGKLTYRLLPVRRRIVLENLERAFGRSRSRAELTALAEDVYGHFARFVVEFVTLPWLSHARRAHLVRVENEEALEAAATRGRGVLVLAGHLGNWEVATVAGFPNFRRFRGRFHFVRRPLRPRWLERLVVRRALAAGLRVIPKHEAMGRIRAALAAGDAVAFILDQHASGREGVAVDFFGHPARTFRSLAVVARATGAPVVPVAIWREPGGGHVIRFEEALAPSPASDRHAAVGADTQAFTAVLEAMIRRHPEQWIWMHRRWRAAEAPVAPAPRPA